MKKFLLFLSCFLITWCSVQAATPSGKITSATYNASSSTFNVSCTASNSNNVYMDVICMKTGPVVSKVKLSTYSSTTINLPITSRDGEYDLVLYVNGTPCYDKKVTVSKYGDITNVTNISTSSVTVKYSMFHAETDNYPNNSYLKIGNYKHNITNVKNGSYKWTGLKLTEGQTYTCEMYVDGKRFDSFKFTVPSKYGHINNVSGISKSSVTVNYIMRNAETSNSYLKIGNYKHNITNVENGSYTWSGLNLTEGQTYTCEIYVDGVRKHTYNFTVPNPINQITSATYDANNSTIKANVLTYNVTTVKLGLLSTALGNSIYNPLNPKTYSVPNVYGYSSSTTLNVDPTLPEGQVMLILCVNGNTTPSHSVYVNVTAKGSIKGVNVDREKGTFTVDYSMQHGSASNSLIRIYDDEGTTIQYEENIKNPNTNVNTYRNISLPYSTLDSKLEGGKYYRCRLYTNGKKLAEYRFIMPMKSIWSDGLKLSKVGNSIKVDFTISNTGVPVEIVLYDLKTYTQKNVKLGTWWEHTGTTYIDVPASNGPATYVATLIKNGVNVNGAQLYVR